MPIWARVNTAPARGQRFSQVDYLEVEAGNQLAAVALTIRATERYFPVHIGSPLHS